MTSIFQKTYFSFFFNKAGAYYRNNFLFYLAVNHVENTKVGSGDGPSGHTLYTSLVIKIYNHTYKEVLPTSLTLNRLSRLKGINPAKLGGKYVFFCFPRKNSVITCQKIMTLAQLETPKK